MKINSSIIKAENELKDAFIKAEQIALENQNKVLQAFIKNKISSL